MTQVLLDTSGVGEALTLDPADVASVSGGLRQRIAAETGSDGTDGLKFLDWFDKWFLARATPAGEAA